MKPLEFEGGGGKDLKRSGKEEKRRWTKKETENEVERTEDWSITLLYKEEDGRKNFYIKKKEVGKKLEKGDEYIKCLRNRWIRK